MCGGLGFGLRDNRDAMGRGMRLNNDVTFAPAIFRRFAGLGIPIAGRLTDRSKGPGGDTIRSEGLGAGERLNSARSARYL